MIERIRLIAAREFRQIAATRGFWITLLIIPLALAIGPLTSGVVNRPQPKVVMLIDPAGLEAPAIRERLMLDHQRSRLIALARYAERHGLTRVDPAAPWARRDTWYTDGEVEAFRRSGGVPAALARMRPAMKPDTPPFRSRRPEFLLLRTPDAIRTAPPETLDRLVAGRLNPPEGAVVRNVDYAIYIPPGFGTAPSAVRIWANGPLDDDLMQAVDSVLTRDLRTRFLQARGVDGTTAAEAARLEPVIRVTSPPVGEGRERVAIRSIVPLASAYLLFLSLMLSGQWMLQGLVEERANKLLEAVLACVSPAELMYGKLAGIMAVGLTMILFWIGCAATVALAARGMTADMLRPALAPLASPGVGLAMLYFFLAGYLLVSMIFLAIGAMSESFRDAQNYLTPVILTIMIPFVVLASALIRNPESLGIRILSWIPIYTPFAMLARLGQGVPAWEMTGAGALLAAFLALEFVMLGRVFRQSLLNAGERPGLKQIGRMMRSPAMRG